MRCGRTRTCWLPTWARITDGNGQRGT
jgi:hypothetical protein